MTTPTALIVENEIKCRISESCFYALGSLVGFDLQKVPQESDCGVDYRLVKKYWRNGKLRDGSPILEFQLKSTVRWQSKANNIEYYLESKTYNDLTDRNRNGGIPLILVIMFLPNVREDWLTVCEDDMTFLHSLYWYHTSSKESIKSEYSKKKITVPRENLLTRDSFAEVVKKHCVKRDEKNP